MLIKALHTRSRPRAFSLRVCILDLRASGTHSIPVSRSRNSCKLQRPILPRLSPPVHIDSTSTHSNSKHQQHPPQQKQQPLVATRFHHFAVSSFAARSAGAGPLLFAGARGPFLAPAGISVRNMSTVKLEKKSEFTHIIDAFLRSSDLKTVSLRNVRAHLQNVLGYDLTPVKDEIRLLIQERFNEILAEEEKPIKPEVKYERPETDEALSELESSPPSSPKATKPSRKHNLEDDKKLAARLHKELNAGRPSRQAAAPQKKKAAPKKKAVKKSKAEVDSDSADEDGQPKKKRAVNRNNPFNALMQLSEPLSDLIGRSECSRPETVKAIWDYVKKNNLQDENDKRYIVCDDSLKRVFDNAERVHMFTMNKLLSAHISPLPKTEETPSA